MKRQALIIGAPDADIPGVYVDVENYKDFLLSLLGGYWHKSEITVLINPSKPSVQENINILKEADYAMVIFAGHGHQPKRGGPILISLSPNVEIDSSILKYGATKQTLILDCCRVLAEEQIMLKASLESVSHITSLNSNECRKYYDKRISECSNGLVVMYGCDVDETCSESKNEGGHYSSELIQAARYWHETEFVDTQNNYDILSVRKAHELAEVKVKSRSGGRQNPVIEYPRTSPYFPFAVIA